MFKNKYTSVGIGAVIVIVALVFVVNDFYKEDVVPDNTKEITDGNIGIGLLDDSGNAEIKQIPIPIDTKETDSSTNQRLDYPELNRELVFKASFSEDARVIITSNVATLTTQLNEDKNSFNNWLDLAAQYKIIDDYDGAREVWEFLNEAFPSNNTSFNNLGDLYHYNLKDFPKSEENFKKAIKNSPNNVSYYINFHELYKYSYKQDTTLAVDILLEGLTGNPNNIDLLTNLAVYYKEVGNTINAKETYTQARDQAQNLGNTQLVDLLNQEIAELSNL